MNEIMLSKKSGTALKGYLSIHKTSDNNYPFTFSVGTDSDGKAWLGFLVSNEDARIFCDQIQYGHYFEFEFTNQAMKWQIEFENGNALIRTASDVSYSLVASGTIVALSFDQRKLLVDWLNDWIE